MELTQRKNDLMSQRAALQESMDKVLPFTGLNYDVRRILGFQYIKFRFGRISREYYEKFSAYVYDTKMCIRDRYRRYPPMSRHRPWPASPNMKPNRKE